MPSREPRVDAYIKKAPDFAQPILTYVRDTVHAACPDVEERIRWGMPFFDYQGQMMCHMAAFKAHASVGFFKAGLIDGLGPAKAEKDGAGSFGKVKALADLPKKRELSRLVTAAMKLKDEGASMVRAKKARPALPVPKALTAALAKNKSAKERFAAMPPSHKREYSEWIGEAKREETQQKRVAQAVEWITNGKSRNWKYK